MWNCSDGVAICCSFCGCEINSNYDEHTPSTDDEKEIISYYSTSRKVTSTQE